VRDARLGRNWSQRILGAKVGLTGARVSQIEAGRGYSGSLEIWFALSHALGIPLRVELQRDPVAEPIDAGHLKLQELLLRLGRETGRGRSFELPTRPVDPSHSIDVCLRDDGRRQLLINECWNTFGNVNASVRSTHRKIAEAEQMAVAIGGDAGAFRVAACWIVRDTRANRALIARYPEVFATTFTGSSARWVEALTTTAVDPPAGIGLVWSDVNATRVFAWRKR
jgi:transcriptional regulator with XRE-family HTH domain